MKNIVVGTLAALMTVSFSAAAIADDHTDGDMTKTKAEVVERNAQGKATKISIADKVYDVCMSDADDDCINPREAGLDFGNVPLNYWPGKPASEM